MESQNFPWPGMLTFIAILLLNGWSSNISTQRTAPVGDDDIACHVPDCCLHSDPPAPSAPSRGPSMGPGGGGSLIIYF